MSRTCGVSVGLAKGPYSGSERQTSQVSVVIVKGHEELGLRPAFGRSAFRCRGRYGDLHTRLLLAGDR